MTSGSRTRRAPNLSVVAAMAACVFCVIVLLLAAQLRAGHDPGLGTAPLHAAVKHTSASQGHAVAPLVTKSSGGG